MLINSNFLKSYLFLDHSHKSIQIFVSFSLKIQKKKKKFRDVTSILYFWVK